MTWPQLDALIMRQLRHKYGAKRCEHDNIKFPSMLERNCYIRLKQLKAQGRILFFLRQIGFDLPGGQRHFVDFEVFTADGGVKFLEAKGRDLEVGRIKRLQTEDIYQIPVHVIKTPSEIDGALFT